jgi:di/tricarboxylate transporter
MSAHALDWLAWGGLGGHGVAMLAVTAVAFAAFAWERIPIASVSLALLVTLPLFFSVFPLEVGGAPLDPGRFFSGFGHPALVTICALMVLGHALVVTGSLDPVARRVAALVSTRPKVALAAVLTGVMLVSGVVNDTPVVVLMIPLLLAATARAKVSPAGILMPMNFAVLIGGMSTTIGTSTNLIVNSIATQLGMAPLGMFSFYGMVLLAALPGLLYLWLLAPRMLARVPQREDGGGLTEDAFDAELKLPADSPFMGKELRELLLATDGQMRIVAVHDEKGRLRSKLPTATLRPGDSLTLQDTVPRLKEFEKLLDASLHGLPGQEQAGPAPVAKGSGNGKGHGDDDDTKADAGTDADASDAAADAAAHATGDSALPPTSSGLADEERSRVTASPRDADAVVAQLVVTPQSPLLGRTVRGVRLADRYRLAAVGLRPARPRRATPLASKAFRRAHGALAALRARAATATSPQTTRLDLADRRLATGDVLLVQGRVDDLVEAQRDGIGLLLDQRLVLPRHHKAWLALATMAVVILLAATKVLPIAVAALGGVLVLLASRALAFSEAGAALSLKVVLLVAASFALGDALASTGATAWMAGQLVAGAGDLQPRWILVLLMLLMGLLTNFVSNNAAAAIGTPLAIELARQLGLPAEPYVLAVLFGCNLCYLTPMGYQTNLLVMNAAGYRFGDFVRVGGPLFLIMGGGLSAALVWRYGL